MNCSEVLHKSSQQFLNWNAALVHDSCTYDTNQYTYIKEDTKRVLELTSKQ